MKKILFYLAIFMYASQLSAEVRTSFDSGWLFCLQSSSDNGGAGMEQPQYNDSGWRKLNLPHDWAIEGDVSASAPSGAGGGALPGGIGWYRKHFQMENGKWKIENTTQHSPSSILHSPFVFIDFDGVYMNSTVWINGHKLGTRPFGYISFRYDLTPYLKEGDNVIAVKVDNSDQPNSRWYSGCGIYRHTWLVEANKTHVAHWGTHITTDVVGLNGARGSSSAKSCVVKIDTKLEGKGTLKHTILDMNGKVVGSTTKTSLKITHPRLWSVADPYLYTLRTEVLVDGKVVDTYDTPFGVRTIKFDAQKGFFLNGKSMKINGVCLHHDLGCLGAALYNDGLHRQLLKMKQMGVNAIRCTHNPPAPELLNMCDTMGFMVMDECFDMWLRRKTKNDYARFFKEWHERDFSDMLQRDRNHPSIIMWSIGNEVLEQWKDANADNLTLEQANLILNKGHEKNAKATNATPEMLLAQHLTDIVHQYDTTRPITAGCNEPSPENFLFQSGALDIIGFNYHNQNIPDVPKNFPGKPFVITESVSATQSRGVYTMPSDSMIVAPTRWDISYTAPEYTRSAYDNCHVPWGSTHEETWDIVKHNDFVSGQFIWTGWDYIGEPTPFDFPAHSSYFGIVDLAGYPKDAYYMYQSEWTSPQPYNRTTSQPVLHLFPHWNWFPGDNVDMWCYYNNADEIELFVNGKSMGRKSKTEHQYHVSWRVVFEPGEVKVVAYKNGKAVGTKAIRTAGAPDHVRLTPDYVGKEITFYNAEVVDKDGNLCPWADNDIYFNVKNGKILGVDNGDAASLERYQADHRRAFQGKAIVVVKNGTTVNALMRK